MPRSGKATPPPLVTATAPIASTVKQNLCRGMEVLVGCPGEVGSRIGINTVDAITCTNCGGKFTRWVLTKNRLEHRREISRD